MKKLPLYLLLMGLTLVSCSIFSSRASVSKSSLVPSGLFSESCKESCWQDLIPGLTSEAEFIHIIKNKYKGFIVENYETDYSFYSANYINEQTHINAYIVNNVLYSLELAGQFDLELNAIIITLGAPEFIKFNPYTNPSDTISVELILYYPQFGYIFYHTISEVQMINDDAEICLKSDGMINKFQVYKIGTIMELINFNRFPISDNLPEDMQAEVLNELTNWKGFGCYQLLLK